MAQEYTLQGMINNVRKLFKQKGYFTYSYPDRLSNIRLPLDCVKWKGGKEYGDVEEEVAVEIITEDHIHKDNYLSDRHFGKFLVKNASSVKFLQYYLPKAKVYWAYGSYVKKDQGFDDFKKSCADNGIGLIKVSARSAKIVQRALSMDEILQQRMKDKIMEIEQLGKQTIIKNLSEMLSDFEDEYLQYLVFYGAPRFTRREITGRYEEDLSNFLSILLINRLETISNIVYSQKLKQRATEYRYEEDNDHQIALDVISDLWKQQIGEKYPDIHRDFEQLLLLDPKYRDHFLHQFQVFLLGSLIIDVLYGESWVGKFKLSYGSNIEDAWLACSTYHDYNYSIQQWETWMQAFLEKNFHIDKKSSQRHLTNESVKNEIAKLYVGNIVIRDEFISKMGRLCAAIGCTFDDKFERFVLHRIVADKNHAVLGSFTLLEKLGNNSSLTQLAIDQASSAIFIHDEPNWQALRGDKDALKLCGHNTKLCYEEKQLCSTPILKHLTLDTKPLAFLLAFCDVSQEWGRGGKGWQIQQPRLEELVATNSRILVHISVLNDKSYDLKEPEITRLGRYLKDDRFKIKLSSREGQRHTTIDMSGT